MTKELFMNKLKELLSDVSPAEREEALSYYEDYISDAGEENEEEVIASLGSPEKVAQTIKASLEDDENTGEYVPTENILGPWISMMGSQPPPRVLEGDLGAFGL